MLKRSSLRDSLVYLNKYHAKQYGDVDLMVVGSETAEQFDRWLAAHDAEVAAKAVSDLAEQLVEREMPEQGAHINTTSYREGLIDGVNRAVIAAQRRAAEIRGWESK